jgi:hypothetical protein
MLINCNCQQKPYIFLIMNILTDGQKLIIQLTFLEKMLKHEGPATQKGDQELSGASLYGSIISFNANRNLYLFQPTLRYNTKAQPLRRGIRSKSSVINYLSKCQQKPIPISANAKKRRPSHSLRRGIRSQSSMR